MGSPGWIDILHKMTSVVLMLLFLVPAPGAGLRTSNFEGGAQSAEMPSGGNFSIDIPAGTQVLGARMNVCPMPTDENGSANLTGPTLRIGDEVIWTFNGTGYGDFGMQSLFSDGSTEKSFDFGYNGGRGESCIRVPKDAVVDEAFVDVDCSGDSYDWTDTPISGPGKGANFGYSIARAGDVNNDGYGDFLIGAPFYSLPVKETVGMAGLFLGGPEFSGKPALFLTGDAAGERLGFSLSGGGDINGDGYDDFLIGSPGGSYSIGEQSGNLSGKVRLYLGGPNVDSVPDLIFEPITPIQDFGYSISSAGDLNHDGFDDVIICSPHDGLFNPLCNGIIYMFYGSDIPDNIFDYYIFNREVDASTHTVEGAGDVNHDGFDDFLVMYASDAPKGRCVSVVHELYWRAALYFGGTLYEKLIFSQDATDPAYSFAGGGDLNTDGYDDLLLGGVWDRTARDQTGLASIYLGNPQMDNKADMIIPPGTMAGGRVLEIAKAGDVNGDGFGDMIMGVGFGPLSEPTLPGKAAVFFGGRLPDTIPDLVFQGTEPSEFFGGVVASAGDVNADGRDEFLVASAGDDSGGRDSGTVHLFSLGYGLSGPRLQIGNVPFWVPKTPVRAHGAPQNFTAELSEYLRTAPVTGTDGFGNEYVDVPISVSADGFGILNLSNIRIRYTCTVRIADFTAAANDYIVSRPGGENANNSILINAECSGPALFHITGLDVKYGYGPSMLQPIPDVAMDEESSDYQFLDLWEYFQDDVDPQNMLEFRVLNATNTDAVNVEVVLNRYLAVEAITGLASNNWTGEIKVTVGCWDHDGLFRESNEFRIIVSNVQDPPVITSAPPTEAAYGAKYVYDVVAKDADGDVLHYYMSESPEGMVIDWVTGEISWFPQTRGKSDVHVYVTDGMDWAYQDFTIDVWKNTPPVIQSEPPASVMAGHQFEYDVMASDPEGDPLAFSLRTTAPDMSIDPSTGRILWTPCQDMTGDYLVVVIVSDSFGAMTEQAFIIEVLDPRPGCRITYPAKDTIVHGALFLHGDTTGGDLPVARVEASIDGGGWLPANGTDRWEYALDSTLLDNGPHTFRVRAFNGAYSEVSQGSFVVCNQKPAALKQEVHDAGLPIMPLILFLAIVAVCVVLYGAGTARSRTKHY